MKKYFTIEGQKYEVTNTGFTPVKNKTERKQTPETRLSISKAMKEYYRTHKHPCQDTKRPGIHTQEQCEITSRLFLAKPKPIEQKEKMRASSKGKSKSEEQRKNMSISQKNKIKLPDFERINIKDEYSMGNISMQKLAEKYKVSATTIYTIVKNYPIF
jgi:hypothetical protein